MLKHELLAPAGDIEAAYAAIHFGADAIYLGMKRFSARAEAENFTSEQLGEITAFAHASSPRRKVFVTLNTLILNSELPELVESLSIIANAAVDGIIVQDLGVIHIARQYFPGLALHGSTQLAVHNLAGALALRDLGFRRVTLARELTLDEIRKIAAESGIEVEVFLHGALCYAYSGLCFYSSMLRDGSGNRGRCNYPCRDSFGEEAGGKCFPFSMKDIALPDELKALQDAGVSSFKIEGRKKSPLYVSATTSFYRKMMDGKLNAADRTRYEADIKTIFSRPWTNLFIRSEDNMKTTDAQIVGHRGAPIGRVISVINAGTRMPKLQFKPERPIERHDGLQIDLPGKPFGFPVDTLLLLPPDGRGQGKTEFEAPAGSMVHVILPVDHPDLPKGAAIYASSSQAVKRGYKFTRPKPGEFKVRTDISVEVFIATSAIRATAACGAANATAEVQGTFDKGRDLTAIDNAVRQSFEKLGDTSFKLNAIKVNNPDRLFAPVSIINRLRREVLANLQTEVEQHRIVTITKCRNAIAPAPVTSMATAPRAAAEWSIKTDCLANLSAFTKTDWNDISELIIDIGNESLATIREGLNNFSRSIDREKIRLALPVITRAREERKILESIKALTADGWTKWEASNISAWSYLAPRPASLASDWSMYVLNRTAAIQLMQMGVDRFTLSPEDGLDNITALLREFPGKATVVVYQDTPLFISETCGFANLAGKCSDTKDCAKGELPLVSGKKERVLLITRNCRTIVINERPYCLSGNLSELLAAGATRFRADFIYRRYSPEKVFETWHCLKNNTPIHASHTANYASGLR